MRSVVMLVLAFLLFLGLFLFFLRWTVTQDIPVVGEPPPMPPQVSIYEPGGVGVQPVVDGLEGVRALEATPDGDLFIGEVGGRIGLTDGAPEGEVEAWTTLDGVAPVEDGGLMDLAYRVGEGDEGATLYVLYTALGQGAGSGEGEMVLENRVARLPVEGNESAEPKPVMEGLPAGNRKNGGRLGFGPDGMLYVALGDVDRPGGAQRTGDAAGSILRMTPDGGVPPDNPWAEDGGGDRSELVWAYGFRDVRGLAWHPETGSLFVADRGPGGEWPGIEHLDELNVVLPGRNYGWPRAVGAAGLEGIEDPLMAWVPAHRPGDLAVTHDGDLLMTAVEPGTLLRVELAAEVDDYRPLSVERWFMDAEGRPRFQRPTALAVAPGGSVFMAVAHPDGAAGEERVIRLDLDGGP